MNKTFLISLLLSGQFVSTTPLWADPSATPATAGSPAATVQEENPDIQEKAYQSLAESYQRMMQDFSLLQKTLAKQKVDGRMLIMSHWIWDESWRADLHVIRDVTKGLLQNDQRIDLLVRMGEESLKVRHRFLKELSSLLKARRGKGKQNLDQKPPPARKKQ